MNLNDSLSEFPYKLNDRDEAEFYKKDYDLMKFYKLQYCYHHGYNKFSHCIHKNDIN